MANDPRNPAAPAPGPASGRATAAPPAGQARTAASAAQPQTQQADPVNAALDEFHETHMRNSPLSQNTALYNEAHGHLRALRETFSKLNPPNAAPPPKQVAENQDAFQAGSDNVSIG